MLISTLLLVYWDWDSLKVLFNKTPTNTTKKRLEHDNIWIYLGSVFLIITVLSKFFIENEKIHYSFFSMFIIGIAGVIIGYKRRKLYFD